MNLKSIFDTWLAPLSLDEFRKSYLSKQALYREPTVARLASLASAHDWNVEALLKIPEVKCLGWFESLDGRHLTADLSAEAARKLYQSGMTLYLQNVPELEPLGDAIAGVLQVPRTNIKTALFCNRPSAKTRAHFDPIDTFTLQLKGRKTWWLAPNELAPNPTTSWATLDGSARKTELWLYGHDQLPTEMPANAEQHVLEEGAFLNVPRGFWHQTHSDMDSVSLHVHHVPLPWVDAILVSLRALLLRDQAMRAGANHLWSEQANEATAHELEALLEKLSSAAKQLTVDDVLALPRKPAAPDRWIRRARAGMIMEDASHATFVVAEYGSDRRTTIEMSPPYLEAAKLFVESDTGLSATDLSARIPELAPNEATQLVTTLADAGFLRPAGAAA